MMKKGDLAKGLASLGLKKNDIVLLHSSLSSLGEIEGGADTVIAAFQQVLGKGGTLIVPVFGKLGVVTEKLRQMPGAVVSDVPVGTLAAIGGRAEEMLAGHWASETAHGEGSPYLKIAQAGGYVCLLGVDQDRNTMLHSAEAMLELPYLGQATRTCTDPKGHEVTRTWKYYPGPHRCFIGLDKIFFQSGLMTTARIGNAQVRLLKAADMLSTALELGGDDPAFVLCENPACEDCVRQRAAIDRARFAEESFRLAASTRLAGRYVPEMVENLHAAGIDAVELDYIQGKGCAGMAPEALARAAAEFSEGGIAVAALRAVALPDDWQAMVARCQAAGAARLVLPLTGGEIPYGELKKAGISVLLYNCHQSSAQACSLFAEQAARAAAAKAEVAFAMAPAAFAQAGEMPFLTSWRVGRCARVIGQLDVADCLWDGTPEPLANGNAEVRELVSILRCRNFGGYMVLGGGFSCPGTLKDAAQAFKKLLE